MAKKLLNVQIPFFRPMWRRVAVTALCLGWAVAELLYMSNIWAIVFGAIGVYLVWELFFAFDPVDPRSSNQGLRTRVMPNRAKALGRMARPMAMADWVRACAADDIDPEDLIRFDHGGRSFAIYRSPADEYFCTDGLCTHEAVHLEDGLVMDYVIECPKHNGQFDYRTGAPLRSPVCDALATYPAKLEDGEVFVLI